MMLGAAIVEIAVIDNGSPIAPLVLMAMLAVVVWFRRDTITTLPARLGGVRRRGRVGGRTVAGTRG